MVVTRTMCYEEEVFEEETEPVLKRSLAFRKMATRNKYRNLRRSFLAHQTLSSRLIPFPRALQLLFGLILRNTDRLCISRFSNCFVQWGARNYGRVLIRKRARRSK